MIRYARTPAKVEADVDAAVPNWRSRARRRASRIVNRGRYHEATQIWTEVKPVFMRIQHNKCAYCEQQVEGGALGVIACDLEHFRPKSNVRVWPEDAATYPFATGDALAGGYYRLAYQLGNYVAACKVCNTLLKSDYFPIAATRIESKNTPEEYAVEGPFLIYPIGYAEDDPEDIIAFRGVEALPRHSAGEKWRRAIISIDFLGLNREGLQTSRAYTLLAVWEAFKGVEHGDAQSQDYLHLLTSEFAAHTSCARYFRDLCRIDWTIAAAIASECLNLIRRNDT